MVHAKQRPIRRLATQAIDAGDKFLSYVIRLKDIFEPTHPEYIPLLEAISQMIIMAQMSMGDFFEQAWKRKPPNDPRLAHSIDKETPHASSRVSVEFESSPSTALHSGVRQRTD